MSDKTEVEYWKNVAKEWERLCKQAVRLNDERAEQINHLLSNWEPK